MADQLLLNIAPTTDFNINDYAITNFNQQICDALAHWQPSQPGEVKNDPWHNSMLIYGGKGSGKTYTLNYWCKLQSTPTALITAEQLASLTAEQLALQTFPNLAIDNADLLLHQAPEHLLHLLNQMQASNQLLLLSMSRRVAEWPDILPDLKSRLLALRSYSFAPLNEEELAMFWQQQLADRQLKLEPAVSRYLLARVERTPGAIRDLVGRVDQFSATAKEKITIPRVRNLVHPDSV